MLLPIIKYPNKVLETPTKKVVNFDEDLKELVANMVNTMHDAKGIGLAAPQVGEPLRLTIIEYPKQEDDDFEIPLTVLVNPKLISSSGLQPAEKEGCLSILGIEVPIERAQKVKIKAQDIDGNKIRLTATGLFARIVQHELDHLDGKLILDYAPNKQAVIKEYESKQ